MLTSSMPGLFVPVFDAVQKTRDDIPKWRVRPCRSQEEQVGFNKKNKLVFEMNQESKAAKLDVSYSLRTDGSVWKFVKQSNGSWKRDEEWSFNEESHADSASPVTGNGH